MKTRITWLFLCIPFLLSAQVDFDTYFTDTSMRFDFLLAGNQREVTVFPAGTKEEPFWAGNPNNLIDTFDYGSYRFRVFDKKTGTLIFSKGFSTLFQEWQTTAEARNGNKTFYQSAIFPYPRKPIRLEIDARQRDGMFSTIFSTDIDPKNYFILNETRETFKMHWVEHHGAPSEKVDIVVLAEGYTKKEQQKFFADADRLFSALFAEEPFKTERESFNVNAVFTPSLESGTDVPGEHIYRNTRFNSSFYTFDIPRYLTTTDMKAIYDAAASVPYDYIYLLVNTDRYGGGGFYNLLTVCTADNERSPQVFIHEFGHGFAGLADEYYTSDVAYEDFYNLQVEPWEPNLTTLVDFDKKWKAMLDPSTPVPTPRKARYKNTVGVYEGGGYMSKGIYSPYMNCRMKSNESEGFCPVCQKAIGEMIRANTK